MFVRSWNALVACAVLAVLTGCQAAPVPPAPLLAEPASAAPPPARLTRAVRPRRPDGPCKPLDLSAERKAALFRQFAALQEGAEPGAEPASTPHCTQASR